jgi:sphingolipid delta-4 desaturase
MDGWTAANIVIQFVCIGLLAALVGAGPFKYLIASTVFAIGLHPLGARWIQEHFARVPDQETYSYYGPLNKVCFNVGYHNEHHDLVTIPWSRLPEVRRMAPEFYAGLHSYSSWTALLIEFLRNRQMTLFDYIIRPRTTDRSPSDDTVQWHPKDEKAPQPRYQAGTSMAGKG